jgi:SAM-dependent methyltransferase
MLDGLGIDYVVPFDIADLRDGSVDVLVSRAVLEHVRPDVLEPLLRECRRVLKPNGFMCHIIDNTDHYAHADRSINYVNFLRFEEWQWRLLTVNPFHYTNRLRHSDYRALLANAGFAIAQERTFVDNRSLQALDSMRVAPRYRDRDPADLAIATSLFVAVPRSSASRGAA